MGKSIFVFIAVWSLCLYVGTGRIDAAITYGNGYYLNLCGSGTVADSYTCNSGCNPTNGTCVSSNTGVVKWVCSGKWNQCQERESVWSNSENLGNPGCDKTVQISLFDRKCRMADGRWNPECRLLGYMVWYSGDCFSQVPITPSYSASPSGLTATSTPRPTIPEIKPSATPKPSPTLRPTATPKPTITPKATTSPTPVPVSPTNIPNIQDVCGKVCKKRADCGAGFSCYFGACRNPSCVDDKSCFCEGGASTESAVAVSNPETGIPWWLAGVFLGSTVIAGWIMQRTAKRIW